MVTIATQRWQHERYTGFACGPAQGLARLGRVSHFLVLFSPWSAHPAQLRPLSHPGSWQLCSCSPAQTWTHLPVPFSLGQEEWATAAAKPVLPENSIQEKPSLGEARPRG